MKGRQGRFLGTIIVGWIAARAWLLWPVVPLAIGTATPAGAPIDVQKAPPFTPAAAFQPMRIAAAASGAPAKRAAVVPRTVTEPEGPREPQERSEPRALDGDLGASSAPPQQRAAYTERAPASPTVALDQARAAGRAMGGQAYLFYRPGSGRAALAPGGSLGGSQAAARVAVALNRDGPVRTAIAARLYAPLQSKGAEAAVGLDWHPLAGVPLRFSIERRIGLDRAGRNAWSAYAAGGFFAGGLPLRLEADGYAQAGVVGARSRDLFVDGALRVGRRIALGKGDAVVGAGTWGAAQPGAARLDAGPRLAVSLPVERHRLTLAAEGRFRLAGRAAPGSGAALTLTADF